MIQAERPVRLRKIAARRRRRRFILRLIGLLVLVAVLSGVVHAFSSYVTVSPRFQVKKIRVEGAIMLKEEAILAVAGITKKDNLWLFDSAAIQHRVESMPYVKRCEVQRVYPDLVIIRIEERTPAASLVVNTRVYEIDVDGVPLRELVLRDPPTGPLITGIPNLDGVELSKKIESPELKTALETWRAFSTIPLAAEISLSEISMADPQKVVTFFDDTAFEVRWSPQNLVQQAQRLDFLWHERKGQFPCTIYLDLRFENEIACK